MKMQKINRLAAIVMLIMLVKPAFEMAIDDEHHLPDAPKSEAQMYFDQIPEEKRDEFIRYFLGKGLQQQGNYVPSPATAGVVDIEMEFGASPRGFTTKLLEWTKNTFQLEDNHVVSLVEGAPYVCLHSGCYNPYEIGAHCCPF